MTKDRVKIRFRLEREGGYPPFDTERMWAEPLPDGTFRLDNIPFFVRGVATEDVVAATNDEGALWYAGLVREGGHSTVRLLLGEAAEAEVVRELLRSLGCSSEGTGVPGLIAVDIPPAVGYAGIRKILAEGEDAGRWEFEEGCVAGRSGQS